MSSKPKKPSGKIKSKCGIVMPISPIDGCSSEHWVEVRELIFESIEDAGMEARLVSDSDDVGVIQKRIIQNLFEDPIVVCDVSGKNPNVMFELGIRLAFDKPVVIIKDDKTNYSFDTAPIEHLEYPRDMRFSKIVEFKEKLTEKTLATLAASKADAGYSPFLKHFGEYKAVKLDGKLTPPSGMDVYDELRSIKTMMYRLFEGRKFGNDYMPIRVKENNDLLLKSIWSAIKSVDNESKDNRVERLQNLARSMSLRSLYFKRNGSNSIGPVAESVSSMLHEKGYTNEEVNKILKAFFA